MVALPFLFACVKPCCIVNIVFSHLASQGTSYIDVISVLPQSYKSWTEKISATVMFMIKLV